MGFDVRLSGPRVPGNTTLPGDSHREGVFTETGIASQRLRTERPFGRFVPLLEDQLVVVGGDIDRFSVDEGPAQDLLGQGVFDGDGSSSSWEWDLFLAESRMIFVSVIVSVLCAILPFLWYSMPGKGIFVGHDGGEEGGEFDTADGRHTKWEVEILATTTADLFSVNFTCTISALGETEAQKTVQTFMLLRPTWSIDPSERSKLREQAKTRIAEMQGKKK